MCNIIGYVELKEEEYEDEELRLEFIANSGQWRVPEDGTIETCRDRMSADRPTGLASSYIPISQSTERTRKRLWCNGQRVHANRAVWRQHMARSPRAIRPITRIVTLNDAAGQPSAAR